MTILLFANNAASTLAGGISNSALTASLAAGGGAQFPHPVAGEAFRATFIDVATGLLKEIVEVSNVTGDVITMTRGAEGTTPLAWSAGDLFQQLITAGQMSAMLQVAQAVPTRVITASGAFALTNADGAVGLARVAAVAVSSTVLPAAPTNGQIVEIIDLVGNFNGFPVTVAPNAGQTIAALPGSAVLNINRMNARFKYFTTGSVWSLSS